MTCPECGNHCWREEVDIGVGVQCGPWMCSECSWTQDDGYPMLPEDWENKVAEESQGTWE